MKSIGAASRLVPQARKSTFARAHGSTNIVTAGSIAVWPPSSASRRLTWALIAMGLLALSMTVTVSTASARRVAVKRHVATWAYVDGCNGGDGASPQLVRAWVSFAESNCGVSSHKARRDCHAGRRTYCYAMQYFDTDWGFSEDHTQVAQAASPNWWLHAPARKGGESIFSSTLGGGLLVNQSQAPVRAFFRSYARQHYNSDDGLMMDWQSPSLAQELYYSTCGCTTTREIRTDAALRASHQQMSADLTHRNGKPYIQVDNTLPTNPFQPQGLQMINRKIGVDGWIVEGAPESNGVFDPDYSTLLDQIAYIAHRTRGFIVPMSRAPAGAPYQAQTRRVQEATIMLGYSPGKIVDWADLEQGDGQLAVWPEEGIYPTRPVESMGRPGGRGCLAGKGILCSRGGHRSLQVARGVYRREFRACYSQGAPIGPCAAVVNTTGRNIVIRGRWFKQRFHHQITFEGGDVQSGGLISASDASFQAGANLLGPDDAVLLAN